MDTIKRLLIPCLAGALAGSIVVDLFAGGGGASEGIENASGEPPQVVVNHCRHAIDMHSLNHPTSVHLCDDVRSLKPREICQGWPVGLLWLSPDCRHFSRAKGSAPVSDSVRSLAWEAVTWAKETRPERICLENVPEFVTWGPVDEAGIPIAARKGETFRAFITALQDLGYVIDYRVLCAADFGAPTSRKRLFLVARCDGQPIVWPEPTHGPGRPLAWLTAGSCIDWSIPVKSIFGRKRPLADATCRRIAHGIARYVLSGEPYLVSLRGTEATHCHADSLDRPLRTISAGGSHHALVAAFLAKHYGGVVGQPLDRTLGTVTAVDHHSLVGATLITTGHGERPGQAPRVPHLDKPLGTVVSGGSNHALVAVFLVHYYGSGGQGQRLTEPMHTVVTKARHGLVIVPIAGQDYVPADIGMRMLVPRELARAQGFPDSYILTGSQRDQIARIGNSVCPPVAKALVAAQLGGIVPSAAE